MHAFSVIVGLVAASGLVLMAVTTSYAAAFVGFALIFGGVNGVGYGAALDMSAALQRKRSGAAMATVTASYALGATAALVGLDWMLQRQDLSNALITLSIAIAAISIIVWVVLRLTNRSAETAEDPDSGRRATFDRQTAILWLAYGLSVTAGLMVLGHAAEIVPLTGASHGARQSGVVLLTVANRVALIVAAATSAAAAATVRGSHLRIL